KHLGKRLPEILRQYYLQLGNNKQINQTQDKLLPLSKLKLLEDSWFVFYWENQGVWEASISFTDFELENPPIYLNVDNSDWESINLNVLNFLKSMAYLQGLFAFPFNANGREFDVNKLNFIKENWRKIKFGFPNWEVSFYQNSFNEIISLMGNNNVFIATKELNMFEDLVQKLKIDWDYNSLEDE
ncbi:MAG: hypothetical protein MUC29_14735, partial [Pyrinomonadaceae bacterium]|nr:hypothetical protein [Pyrinomonadaceae bacterium]